MLPVMNEASSDAMNTIALASSSDIETAKPCDGLIDQSANVIFLAVVGVDELGLGTERAQLLNERLAGLFTPPDSNHPRAPLGKGDRSRAAYDGRASRDQHD
jgi:hypothetical protein